MSPRAGGEAAKFGDRYESRWTVRQLLAVIAGDATSLTVEDEAALAEGAEFTLRRPDGSVEVHQVKRQPGMRTGWSLGALRDIGVLAAAAVHAEAGRSFHFVSTIPAPWLKRLSDGARNSSDPDRFVCVHVATGEAQRQLAVLEAADVWGDVETAWRNLRRIYVSWPDEDDLRATNAALARVYLAGANAGLMAAGLADLIVSHLGLPLTVPEINARLGRYGMAHSPLVADTGLTAAVDLTRDRWLQTFSPVLLDPEIPRREAREMADALRDGAGRTFLVAGAAGSGKSMVLRQVVAQLDGWPILAVRIDRTEPFTTPSQLAQQLGLSVPPVPALAAVAEGRPCLLVVDQLDAVSLASGRLPYQLDPVIEMLRETRAFPEMRVLLACRQFDLDHDYRLRELVASGGQATARIVGPLAAEEIDAAVTGLGIPPEQLTGTQRELLALPLHLVLLAAIANDDERLAFRSTNDLLAAFYERKEQDCRLRNPPAGVRFGEVVRTLAGAMSSRQRLSAPRAVLDAGLTRDADIMESERVLVRDGNQVAFFHESFFDFAFARSWVAGDQSLRDWLLDGEQSLFVRAQVRQILLHLHEDDPERFRRDVRECLLDDGVRFHVKDAVVRIVAALGDVSTDDWQLVHGLIEEQPPFVERLWLALRTEGWFRRLDAEGMLEAWLRSDDPERRSRALEIMAAGMGAHGDRAAELLVTLSDRDEYGRALMWVLRARELYESRGLFDRFLEAVRHGRLDGSLHEVFLTAYRLSERRPAWGAELLEAWLTDSEAPLEALNSTDHGLTKMIIDAADGAPLEFARALLPYMLGVMRARADDDDRPPMADPHFSYRDYAGSNLMAGEQLAVSMGRALRRLGEEEPEMLREFLPPLLAEPLDAAQWLAYQGFIGAGAVHARWAADVLAEAGWRLESGYDTDPFWTARELILAISPSLDHGALGRIEAAVDDIAPELGDYQRRYAAFSLLSALPSASLSPNGRERLAELRADFGAEQPPEPEPSVQGGWIGSPVDASEAEAFSDDEWLAAIREYSTDHSFGGHGGAVEVSRVLEQIAKREPARFAALGLRLDSSDHGSYPNALLMALADPAEPVEPELVFALIRHIAGIGHEESQRWLGWPLTRLADENVPDDVIALILRVALEGQTPETDVASNSADIWTVGINTVRGQAAHVLAQLLSRDADGHRTELVAPSLPVLASDRNIGVRAEVAQLMGTALRHARPQVLAALPQLLDADDRLLAARSVQNLVLFLGNGGEQEIALDVIRRALNSRLEDVREAGGRQAAYAGLEWRHRELLEAALGSDATTRKGAATLCARRLPVAGDGALAAETLLDLFADPADDVREAAALVAGTLRDQALRPYEPLLRSLIGSPAFEPALPQLLITLEHAPDRVDDLLGLTTRRFLEVSGEAARSLANAAAADAHQLGELVMRWYGQAEGPAGRAEALDLIDMLLEADSFGVGDLVGRAER